MGKGNNQRKAKPTEADIEAAARLLDAWEDRKRGLGLTQEKIADRLGGKSQGLVSQYLHGRIPLNYRALLVFCDALRIPPESIRDDLPEQQMNHSRISEPYSHSARLDPAMIEHAKMQARTTLEPMGVRFDPHGDVDVFLAAYALVTEPTLEMRAAFDANIAKRTAAKARGSGAKQQRRPNSPARGRNR